MFNISNLLNPMYWLMVVPTILISLTFHEYSHALVAYFYGDKTAKNLGRLTLNPISHLDPVGTISMLLMGFGWAKPVPVNPDNFRNRKWGEIWVSVAGPLSNLILAFIALTCLFAFPITKGNLYNFIVIFATLNVALAVFNILPIPPLDGSHILMQFLPYRAYLFFVRNQQMIYLGMILLLFSGILTPLLGFLRDGIISAMVSVLNLIFGGINGASNV